MLGCCCDKEGGKCVEDTRKCMYSNDGVWTPSCIRRRVEAPEGLKTVKRWQDISMAKYHSQGSGGNKLQITVIVMESENEMRGHQARIQDKGTRIAYVDIKNVKNYGKNGAEKNDSNPRTKISKELVLEVKVGGRE